MRAKTKHATSTSFMQSIRNAIPKHCSNCGHKYSEGDLSLVKREHYNALLHLTCSNCKEAYLINVVSPLGVLQGSSRMPLKVDIDSPKEAKKFIGKGSISSDDVLAAHESLKEITSADRFKELLKKNN